MAVYISANEMEVPFIDLVTSVPITQTEDLGPATEVEVPFIDLTTSSPDTDVDTGAPLSARLAPVKTEDTSDCLKFQTVIGGEQVIGSTPGNDLPTAAPHGRVEAMPTIPAQGGHTGGMEEHVVPMSQTGNNADVIEIVVRPSGNKIEQSTQCLKFETIIDGLACVGSSPPQGFRSTSQAGLIASDPVS